MPAAEGAIDLHTHMVPPDLVSVVARHGERLATRIVERDGGRFFLIEETALRPITPRITSVEARLAEMDAEAVSAQALSPVPFLMYPTAPAALALEVARAATDALLAAAARAPDRFVVFATVPLQAPEAAALELERAAGLGVRGVQIPTSVAGGGLDEPRFEPFWATAARLRLPVFLHPFEAAPSGMLARYALGNLAGNLFDTGLAAALLILGGVLERHPSLRLLLAHAGGALPSLLGRLDHGFRIFPEARSAIPRPPSSYLNQIWLDTIAHHPALLRALIDVLGAARFVVGSDYPLAAGLAHPVADLRRLGLPPADTARVLRENAGGLLVPAQP
jgi:aminocarboxymuconate-semialdehyde decarboxylase